MPVDPDFAKLGDLLLREYMKDFVANMQQMTSPINWLWNPYICMKCSGKGGVSKKWSKKKKCCPECAGVGVEAIPLGEVR